MSSVKVNTHQIQTMLETYAIDHYGLYPENLRVLYKEAKAKNYWKDFANPYSVSKDINKAWMASIPLKSINQNTGLMSDVQPRAVVYNPVRIEEEITRYYIYGGSAIENTLLN